MSVLNVDELPVEEVDLHVPDLVELAAVLESGLAENFSSARVRVIDCPDLRGAPYHLAAEGLGGDTRVVDLGGPPYLVPRPRRDRLYDLGQLARRLGYARALVIGAGAGPWPRLNTNCEGVYNLLAEEGRVAKSNSRTSRVDKTGEGYVVERLEVAECALLANVLMARGEPGAVLEVQCAQRTGAADPITCMRRSLHARYAPSGQTVALGGAVVLERGAARQHVMPDFSAQALKSDADVEAWLRFYEMRAPLVALGTLVSEDPGLDLRMQHFHSASPTSLDHAGHYHHDTTPDVVSYRGCFVPAERLTRVDRPQDTHNIGRD